MGNPLSKNQKEQSSNSTFYVKFDDKTKAVSMEQKYKSVVNELQSKKFDSSKKNESNKIKYKN